MNKESKKNFEYELKRLLVDVKATLDAPENTGKILDKFTLSIDNLNAENRVTYDWDCRAVKNE